MAVEDTKASAIVRGMRPWYTERTPHHMTYPDMRAASTETRTDAQKIWDHAILAASEFIRRYDDYDERRSAALMALLSDKLPTDPAA